MEEVELVCSKIAEECLEEVVTRAAGWGMEVCRLRISLKDRRVVAEAAPLLALEEEDDEEDDDVEVAIGWCRW